MENHISQLVYLWSICWKRDAGSGENTDFTSKKRFFGNKVYTEPIGKIRDIKTISMSV